MNNEKQLLLSEADILYPFLCIALGGHAYLHPYLDDLYRKNEWEYYEAYRRSHLNGHPLFSTYTTKSEEKIRQAAGILAWCYENEQFSPLEQLIKKGYKFVYQYLQHHTVIDLEHFMRSFAKRQKNKPVKEIELIYQNVVLWYLCEKNQKLISKNNIAWKSFQDVLQSSFYEIKLELFSEDIMEQNREELDLLYEEYHIPKNNQFDSLGIFIESLIRDTVKRIYEALPECPADQAEQQVFRKTPSKFIGAIGGWLKALNIHELDATDQIPFSKHDLDMVFLQILYVKKYNDIDKQEQDLFFITCLYLKCLSSLFHVTKQLYLDQSKQDFYLEMKAKELKVKEQEAELIRSQQAWQSAIQQQEQEMEALKKELREAKSKVRSLEQKIEDMEDYADEVHSLRNFVFLQEQEEDHADKQPTLKKMQEYIQSKRIVIFGGSPNWRQKLKEVLQTLEFVDSDELNRDISKVQRADAVFINTAVFGHAFYKKIMKELAKCETPLFYLKGQSNIEKTTLEIYRYLKK